MEHQGLHCWQRRQRPRLTGEKGPMSGRCPLHVGISHVSGNLYGPCTCIRRSADGEGAESGAKREMYGSHRNHPEPSDNGTGIWNAEH